MQAAEAIDWTRKPTRAHILTHSISTRGLLNMSALAGTPVAHYG